MSEQVNESQELVITQTQLRLLVNRGYETVSEMETAHPTGTEGEAYMVDCHIYVWNVDTTSWQDIGSFQGPKGETGATGPQPALSSDTPRTDNKSGNAGESTTASCSDHVHPLATSLIRSVIAAGPTHYERDYTPTTAKTTITIPPMWINVNNVGYVTDNAITLNLAQATSWDTDSQLDTIASNRTGMNFYIYACVNTTLKFILSENSTVPAGYTADTSRKIGGFHCLCASVGTLSGHTLSGYVTGDILPASIWDLRHRPKSSPEGMVYISGLGLWVDLYLASISGGKLVSAYGGVTCDGANNYHWYRFAEEFGLVKKRMLWQSEFICAAKGSNVLTNINGSSDPNTTGGHVDTTGRRTISNYGLEDCCGVLWQWLQDGAENYVPDGTWQTSYMSGYTWRDEAYASSFETSQGQIYGMLRRALAGGSWGEGATCGPRASFWRYSPARLAGYSAGRGASEPLVADAGA